MYFQNPQTSMLDAENPNSRTKCNPKQVNNFIYAAPTVAERMMRGDFRTKKEHGARAAKAIADFERAFGGLSE
jgi:hypothetical protein